jgi:hypothetical protein
MKIFLLIRDVRVTAWNHSHDGRHRLDLRLLARGAILACVILTAAGDVDAQ